MNNKIKKIIGAALIGMSFSTGVAFAYDQTVQIVPEPNKSLTQTDSSKKVLQSTINSQDQSTQSVGNSSGGCCGCGVCSTGCPLSSQ